MRYYIKFGEGADCKDKYDAAATIRKFTGSTMRLTKSWYNPKEGYVVYDSAWWRPRVSQQLCDSDKENCFEVKKNTKEIGVLL